MAKPLHTPQEFYELIAKEEGTTHESLFTLIENGTKSVILLKATDGTGEIAHLPLSQIHLVPVNHTQGLIRVLVPKWLRDIKYYFFLDLAKPVLWP